MLDLLDYRRKVFDLYREIRVLGTDNRDVYHLWVNTRNKLFGEHPQSALLAKDKASFTGLPYWDYKPDYRVVSELDTEVEPVQFVEL